MARDIITTIDIGTASVKTIISEKRKEEAFPHILGAGISSGHGLRKGFIVKVNDVAASIKNSIKKASETAKTNVKQAFVSIGGLGIEGVRSKGSILVSRADHEISEHDLKRAIGQSESQLTRNSSSYLLNRDILHFFPISYKIDDEVVIGTPVGMRGEKLEIETLFITAPSQQLSNLIKCMDIAGVAIEDIAADCWAASHAILNKREKEVGCMILNIGGETSSVIVFEEGGPISLENFPIGSNHITYDIAQGLQLLLDEAEQLKLTYSSDSGMKRKLSAIVEPRLKDIFELAESHLNKIKRVKLLPAGVILTGGGSNLSGIEELAKNSLRLPVQMNKFNISATSKINLSDPIWSAALGLCSMVFNEEKDNQDSANAKMFGLSTKKTLLKWFKNFLP